MLFLSFAYYLVQDASIQDASPIPSIGNRSLDAHRCTDPSHRTSIWNIISCLGSSRAPGSLSTQMFHVRRSEVQTVGYMLLFAEHRFSLFICALLVPEYVLAWAIRQFLSARKMTKENKSEYKTLVIFFFISSNHSK